MGNSTSAFEATHYTSTVKSLTGLRAKIDIDPEYQRDVVWKIEQNIDFLDSILMGISPNPIILNHDNTIDKYICIDGKQRLTTIYGFMSNNIPAYINGQIVYYTQINITPEVKKMLKNIDNDQVRVMTEEERTNFQEKKVPMVQYNNLTYDQQVAIFTKIQNGTPLSSIDRLKSDFTNKNVLTKFNEFCDSKISLFTVFYNNNQIKKNYHRVFVSNLDYMLINKIDKPPSLIKRNEYIKAIKNVNQLESHTDRVGAVIDIMIGERLFGHDHIKGNVPVKYALPLIEKIYRKINCKRLRTNDHMCSAIIFAIEDAVNKVKNGLITKSKTRTLTRGMTNHFWKKYQENLANDKLANIIGVDIESESESETESDSLSDSEQCISEMSQTSSDSDDEIIIMAKPKSKLKKRKKGKKIDYNKYLDTWFYENLRLKTTQEKVSDKFSDIKNNLDQWSEEGCGHTFTDDIVIDFFAQKGYPLIGKTTKKVKGIKINL